MIYGNCTRSNTQKFWRGANWLNAFAGNSRHDRGDNALGDGTYWSNQQWTLSTNKHNTGRCVRSSFRGYASSPALLIILGLPGVELVGNDVIGVTICCVKVRISYHNSHKQTHSNSNYHPLVVNYGTFTHPHIQAKLTHNNNTFHPHNLKLLDTVA